MKKILMYVVLLSAFLTACDGSSNNNSDEVQPSTLELAVAAIGGEQSLRDLTTIDLAVQGNRRTNFEAPQPDGLMEASTYDSRYMFDLSNSNLRVEGSRIPLFEGMALFGPSPYTIVINDEVGQISDQVGFIAPGNISSELVGGLETQLRLFTPQLYLREALDDPGLISDVGTAVFNGREHRVIAVAGNHAEIRLFVDSETNLISKLETTENNPLVRDTPIEIHFSNWIEPDQGELLFPQNIELFSGGLSVQDESRVSVIINSEFTDSTFDLPNTTDEQQVDELALSFGEQSHQVVNAFFNMGFAYTELPAISVSEIVPGVQLLSGGMANSLAIGYQGNVVVLEAPASPAHGDNLITEIQSLFPGREITHVIQSHHHEDHAGGVRSLVASGATAVVGNGVGEFWNNVISAPSTIRPDSLSTTSSAAEIEEIALNGTFELDDGSVKITAYHVPNNAHADDMVITLLEVAGERFIFEADLYNAGFGFTVVTSGPSAFFDNMRALGIIDANCASGIPLTIIPAHGVPLSLADAISEINGTGTDISCPAT